PSGATAAAAPVLRGGLRTLDSARNTEAAGAQRTLAFIEQARAGLGTLKSALSDALTGQTFADQAARTALDGFSTLWRTRATATGGGLDGALRVVDAGRAEQAFRVRGLDDVASMAPDARGGAVETLQFSVRGKSSAAVQIDADAAPAATRQRLDQALAPLGVRVGRDGQGGLQFSTRETDWPEVRDSLLVKGGGQRFPAGQFNRPRTEAAAEALQPETWRVEGLQGQRQTLHAAAQASLLLDAAARAAGERLMTLARGADTGTTTAAQAATQAESFRALATRGDFDALAAIAPATTAISRERVSALLRLA
ncbi:MAG: hypothetical protein QM639_19065, partial [Rhodocyclaceae bacterium]